MTSHKLGPGSLVFGATGSAQEFAAQCTAVNIEPTTDQDDDITTLDYGIVAGDTTDSASITGTLLQSYDKDSLLLWCHQNHLKELPFTFVPSEEQPLKVTGTAQITRVSIGGDVKKRNTSDFEFKVIGDYDLTAD